MFYVLSGFQRTCLSTTSCILLILLTTFLPPLFVLILSSIHTCLLRLLDVFLYFICLYYVRWVLNSLCSLSSLYVSLIQAFFLLQSDSGIYLYSSTVGAITSQWQKFQCIVVFFIIFFKSIHIYFILFLNSIL